MDNEQDFQPANIHIERRKFKRIKGTFIVSYAPIKGEEVKFDVSQTRDLSEGGLMFVSGRKFEKDIILKIKLRLPEFLDYVIVKARVVGAKQLAKGPMYETRAQFIEMDEKIRGAIRKLVGDA